MPNLPRSNWPARRIVFGALLAGLIVGGTPGIAHAVVVFSSYSTHTTSGIPYKARAGVNSGVGVYAVGQVAKNASGTVPAGYMGAGAYLYLLDQATLQFNMCKSAPITFTSSASSLWNRFTSGSCGSGTYRASALIGTYNSSTGLVEYRSTLNSPPQSGS